MKVPVRFSFLLAGAVSLCVGLAIPAVTLAGGGPAKPAASPKPDSQKKVWTNDDVVRLNPAFVDSNGSQTTAVSSLPIVVVQPLISIPHRVAARAPLTPEQDPRWYAQQLTALETELAGISSREDELRQFRATSAGSPTGLMLNAPVEGITTDNLIAQLEARRQEIEQQIDTLGDVARQNGLPPGVLVAGSGAVIESAPSIEEQRAQVARQVRDASEQLAQVHGIVAGMQDEASAQNVSLQQPTPGDGGNMTTDLLDRLDNRANALQSAIGNAEDAARSIGVPPGDLR